MIPPTRPFCFPLWGLGGPGFPGWDDTGNLHVWVKWAPNFALFCRSFLLPSHSRPFPLLSSPPLPSSAYLLVSVSSNDLMDQTYIKGCKSLPGYNDTSIQPFVTPLPHKFLGWTLRKLELLRPARLVRRRRKQSLLLEAAEEDRVMEWMTRICSKTWKQSNF